MAQARCPGFPVTAGLSLAAEIFIYLLGALSSTPKIAKVFVFGGTLSHWSQEIPLYCAISSLTG